MLSFAVSFAAAAQVDYKVKLNSKIDFQILAGKPLSDIYTNVSSVKLCYDIAAKQIYFFNSRKFKYHIDFCTFLFGTDPDIELFNNNNYTDNKYRDYVLGTLNYYKSQNLYTIEFVSEDNLNISLLNEYIDAIRKNLGQDIQPKLLINNIFLQTIDPEISFNKIYPTQIFQGQTEQVLVQGSACGLARKIDLKKDFSEVKPTDIIFIEGTPLNLPICAGAVTQTFQTPLSHINILCHNRKTPAAVIVKYDSILKAMNLYNHPIRLRVTADKVSITPCKKEEIVIEKAVVTKPISILYDQSFKQLIKFTKNTNLPIKQIGAKAAGMQELYRIQGKNPELFKVPADGFAIPFYYFQQHIKAPKIASLMRVLYDPILLKKVNADSLLKVIRKAIKNEPINKSLLAQVHKMLQADVSYRFRSSSNAEDIKNFNGAGLYGSYSGIKGDSNKLVEDAIKKVWASVYNLAAYRERKLFNIKEATVSMSVLVHRGFPSEEANGVAITKNLFRPNGAGFTINVQKGEESVVAPRDSVQCDQLVLIAEEIFFGNGAKVYPQYITRSNQTNQPVLTDEQLRQLYFALEKIKWTYHIKALNQNKVFEYEAFAMDIEFKFDKGELYIKQVRPFSTN